MLLRHLRWQPAPQLIAILTESSGGLVGAIISFMRASSIYFGWWRSLLDSHNFVTSSLDIAYIFSCAATRTEVVFLRARTSPGARVNPN